MSGLGGTENATFRLGRLLRQRGHEVVLASSDGPLIKEAQALGIQWRPIDFYQGGILGYIKGMFAYMKMLKQEKPNIIHCQMARIVPACAIAAKISSPKTKVFYHARGLDAETYPKIAKLFDKLGVYIIGNCRHEQKKLIRHGFPANRITYTYNALSFRAFPTAHIDRDVRNAALSLSNFEQQYLTAAARPAEALVEAEFKLTDERKFELHVRTTYGRDAHNLDLRLAYVVLEDSVGPYFQSNYYALGKVYVPPTSPFHVWTTRPSRARVYFNDVAREIYPDANGLVGSVPSTLRRGVPSSFVFTDCYRAASLRSGTCTWPCCSSTVARDASSMPPI